MATLNEKQFRSLSLDEQEEFVSLGNSVVDEPSLGGQALDLGLRGLDLAGGLARTSAAGLTDLARVALQVPEAISQGDIGELTNFPTATKQGDVLQALKGRAPGTSEFAERAGVPEGAKLNLLPEDTTIPFTDINIGRGETSLRDAISFGGDVLLDPLNLLTGGAAVGLKAGLRATATPVKSLTRATGRKIFKSAFKELDQAAKKVGKPTAPSDVLLKHGIAGTSKQVEKKTFDLLGRLKGQRDALLAQADEAGAQVNIIKATSDVKDRINEIQRGRNSIKKTIAGKIETKIDDIIADARAIPEQVVSKTQVSDILDASGRPITRTTQQVIPGRTGINVSEASDIKTSIRQLIGDDAFNKATTTATGQGLLVDLGGGLQRAVEKSASDVVPGLGRQVKQLNDELGTILTVRKPLVREAEKAGRKNLLTSVDGALILGAPLAFIGKKTADAAKTTALRSRFGKLLNDLGKFNLQGRTPGLDTVLRQGAVGVGRDERSSFNGLR